MSNSAKPGKTFGATTIYHSYMVDHGPFEAQILEVSPSKHDASKLQVKLQVPNDKTYYLRISEETAEYQQQWHAAPKGNVVTVHALGEGGTPSASVHFGNPTAAAASAPAPASSAPPPGPVPNGPPQDIGPYPYTSAFEAEGRKLCAAAHMAEKVMGTEDLMALTPADRFDLLLRLVAHMAAETNSAKRDYAVQLRLAPDRYLAPPEWLFHLDEGKPKPPKLSPGTKAMVNAAFEPLRAHMRQEDVDAIENSLADPETTQRWGEQALAKLAQRRGELVSSGAIGGNDDLPF